MTLPAIRRVRTHMIAIAAEPDPCGWEDVYRAYGCPVELDEPLDDDD